MAILSSKSFKLSTPKTRAQKGSLVTVEISPGRLVKMYEADAVAAGYIKPKKKQPPAEDKRRPATGDKAKKPEDQKAEVAPADDLTVISGVGKATERALQVRGIVTFEQLRQVDPESLDYLSAQARQAIAEWRADGTD